MNNVWRCVGGLGTCNVVLKLRTAFGERISIFTPEYSRMMSRSRSVAFAASLSIPTLPPAHTDTKLLLPGGTIAPEPALPLPAAPVPAVAPPAPATIAFGTPALPAVLGPALPACA
jgi:hypothetical protein